MTLAAFLETQMALGLFISLACLVLFFIFPSMYYANLPKMMLITVGVIGCLMVIRFDMMIGCSWACFLMLFIYYGLRSRWYQLMVFNRTYKEWKRHLLKMAESGEPGSDAPPTKQQLLQHVAESWNPAWSPDEIEQLTAGCRNTTDLVERVQQHQKQPQNKESSA